MPILPETEAMMPNLTLVLGGAASGKSALAEKLAEGSRRRPVYIATAQPGDEEMREKIRLHRKRRGVNWTTVEETAAVADVIGQRRQDEVILLECLTMWVMNLTVAGARTDIEAEKLMTAIADCPCPAILVSGETGMGIVPDSQLSRRFSAALGSVNQIAAARAELVLFAVAGLTLTLKGKAPSWL